MSFTPFNPEQSFGFNLHVAAFVMKQTLKDALKKGELQLTAEEAVLLLFISTDGVEQSELQRKLHKDKTNLTRLLDRLAEKDLVTRQRSESSRRQQIVLLTEHGQSTKVQTARVIQALSQRATQDIPPEAQQTAIRSLQILMQNLG